MTDPSLFDIHLCFCLRRCRYVVRRINSQSKIVIYFHVYYFLLSFFFKICKVCCREFTDIANRNRHMRNQHRPIVRKFQCLNCSQVCSTKDALQRHSIRKHDGNMEFNVIDEGEISPNFFFVELPLEWCNYAQNYAWKIDMLKAFITAANQGSIHRM